MKDNIQIILIAVVFSFVGIRLYQKYFKKGENKPGEYKKPGAFPESSKDDDYEPYSKK